MLYKSTIIYEKNNRKKKEKFMRKTTWTQQKQEKKSWTINELKIYQQSENQNIQTKMLKEKIMFSLWKKKSS